MAKLNEVQILRAALKQIKEAFEAGTRTWGGLPWETIARQMYGIAQGTLPVEAHKEETDAPPPSP